MGATVFAMGTVPHQRRHPLQLEELGDIISRPAEVGAEGLLRPPDAMRPV